MARRYGRAPRGEPPRAGVPHGHWKTTIFVAVLSRTGMIGPRVLDGSTNCDASTTYVTRVLMPELSSGDVLITDNLSSDQAPAVRAVIKAKVGRLPLPPPDSPDFNPIEMAFLQCEGASAKSGRAEHPCLLVATARIFELYSPQKCSNYFAAAGYDAD